MLSGSDGRPEFVERVFGTAKEVVVDEWNKEYPSYHRQDIACWRLQNFRGTNGSKTVNVNMKYSVMCAALRKGTSMAPVWLSSSVSFISR